MDLFEIGLYLFADKPPSGFITTDGAAATSPLSVVSDPERALLSDKN